MTILSLPGDSNQARSSRLLGHIELRGLTGHAFQYLPTIYFIYLRNYSGADVIWETSLTGNRHTT
jgi:hypothetical protein